MMVFSEEDISREKFPWILNLIIEHIQNSLTNTSTINRIFWLIESHSQHRDHNEFCLTIILMKPTDKYH